MKAPMSELSIWKTSLFHRGAWLRIALVLAGSTLPVAGIASAPDTPTNQPLLVELFTSEGCSSCPPADALLAQVARQRRDVIVLSEHVTYWNNLGWADPFSSAKSTERQSDYVQHFGTEGPYTPQMIVEGRRQFVGSDRSALHAALSSEAGTPKVSIAMALSEDKRNRTMHVSAKLGASPFGGRLIGFLVQREGHQQVARGENGGRSLNHVSIARDFHDLGDMKPEQAFAGETTFALPGGSGSADYRVVVFLQQGAGGPILAAAATQ